MFGSSKAFSLIASAVLLSLLSQTGVQAQDQHPLAAIPLRSIGPALTSGRVSDFAFDPDRPAQVQKRVEPVLHG